MEQTLEKWSLDKHYKSIHALGENSSKEESLTPIIIVNQMVETILQTVDITIVKNPNFKVLDPACGTGSFLIAWYEVLSKYHSHEHIINNMLWGFETNFSYFRANNKYYQFKNVYKESFLETNKLDNMKFDVIVGNPPYKGKGNPLHLQFLSKCYSITKEKGILSFVQPATFLLDQKKINNFYKDARYLISKDLVSVDIYPKSIFENAAINTAISISLIHKDRNNKTPISVKYVSLNKIVHFEDIELINQFASNETFHSIKNKVIEYCNRFGSLQNKYVDGEFSKYLVPISKLQRYKFNGDEAVLLNNSKSWGFKTPYPNGSQAIALQNTASISTVVTLYPGNYFIKCLTSGRDCCDKTGIPNMIDIKLNENTFDSFTPELTDWKPYKSKPINIETEGEYVISLHGTNKTEVNGTIDKSSAIKNIVIHRE